MGKSLKMFYYLLLTSYAEVDLVDRCLLRKALGTTLPPCGRKGKGQMWTEREKLAMILTSGDSADIPERCGGVVCRVSWLGRGHKFFILGLMSVTGWRCLQKSRVLEAYQQHP